ncbi:hypothetical protein DFH29DRAFT_1005710 [Suillus ampliporus]|nr:hypothetical protein DFH29DRAFT_1005710 [Suillus ampliporus]
MSCAWKVNNRSVTAEAKPPAPPAKHIIKHTNSQSQSRSRAAPVMTLVTAKPVKKPLPRAKSNASESGPIHIARHPTMRSSSLGRSSSPPTACNSSLAPLGTHAERLPLSSVHLLDFIDSLGDTRDEDQDSDEI